MSTQTIIRNGMVTEVQVPVDVPKKKFMTIKDLPHQQDTITSYNADASLLLCLKKTTDALYKSTDHMQRMNDDLEEMTARLEESNAASEKSEVEATKALEDARATTARINELTRKLDEIPAPPEPLPFYVSAFEWVKKKLTL